MGNKKVLPNAIIVDLDGTLFDVEARFDGKDKFEHVSEENWKKDKPNRWCVELVESMSWSSVYIIFLTGRKELARKVTLKQIKSCFDFLDEEYILYMRPNDDDGHDNNSKMHTYNTEIEGKFNVLFAVDDRMSVCQMFRDLGVTALHCQTGDY